MKPNPKGKNNKERVENPENWIGNYSKEGFLNNPELQEDVMRRYTLRNYATGVRVGVIKSNDDPATIAAKLASAHLLGWGKKDPKKDSERGARQYWESGETIKDAYGTSAASYAALGRESQSYRAVGAMTHQESGGAWRGFRSDMPPVMNQAISTDAKSQAAASMPVVVNNLSTPPVVVNAPGGGGGGSPSISEIPALDSSHLNLNSLYYFAP